MIYKFGDKYINTSNVNAISEPDYNDYGFFVNLYFNYNNDVVECKFQLLNSERVSSPFDHGLTAGKEVIWTEAKRQSPYYANFNTSDIYKRMEEEIKKLSEIIEKTP